MPRSRTVPENVRIFYILRVYFLILNTVTNLIKGYRVIVVL